MIWSFIEFIAVVVEAFLVSRFVIQFLGYRNENKTKLKSLMLFTAILFIDCIGTYFIKEEMIFVAGFIIAAFIFSIIFLNGHLVKKALISILTYTIIYFVNLPTLNVISIISDMTVYELSIAQNTSRIVCLFCTKLMYFAVTQCVIWFEKKETYRFKLGEWTIIVTAFLSTVLIGFSLHALSLQPKITDYICLFVTLLLSVLDIVVFVFMGKINTANKQEAEKELLHLQLKQQQVEMHNLERQYNEISILRHDFQNKINCINSLLSETDSSEAKKYVERLVENTSISFKAYIKCSSTVINAVVNEKFGIAEQKNIGTSCRIVAPVPEYLEYDISVLLANLLDNAIEACEKNKVQSEIILTITETAGYIRIIVKNTIEKSVLENNEKLESHKNNRHEHGWGLKSVREITEKHKGATDIYEKDSMFIVSTMLIKS